MYGVSDVGVSDVVRVFSCVMFVIGVGCGMLVSVMVFVLGGMWGNANANGVEYEYGEEEDEDWGYVDEYGNWVLFDDEGEGVREFLVV